MFKTSIGVDFLMDLFNTACIQRWNDKLRPIELVELDYQAHRMMIAYYLGKHEQNEDGFDWTDLIEGGIFALLKTSVLTDLRWNVKERLEEDQGRRKRVNEFVMKRLRATLSEPKLALYSRFESFLAGNGFGPAATSILEAAGLHARLWEFRLLEQVNPTGYEINEIRAGLEQGLKQHCNHRAGCQLLHDSRRSQKFVDLCGELRYQGRWSHMHVVPRVTVLGHSMFVATMAYLFSLEAGACKSLRTNNFFTGLFHDLPESQTRDVRSPLKTAIPELGTMLDEMSEELMEKEVLPLLPSSWGNEFKLFSLYGLGKDWIHTSGSERAEVDDVLDKHNLDTVNPTGGRLVKVVDKLAALIEAQQAIRNGCGHPELKEVASNQWKEEDICIGPLDLSSLRKQISV